MYIKILDKNSVKNEYNDTDTVFAFFKNSILKVFSHNIFL